MPGYKKYFSILILIFFLIFLSSYLKVLTNYLTKVMIIEKMIESKHDLAKIIVNNVLNKNSDKVYAVNHLQLAELRNQESYINLYQDIDQILQNLSSIQVNIYNINMEKVFPTNNKTELPEFLDLQKTRLDYLNTFNFTTTTNYTSFTTNINKVFAKMRLDSKITANGTEYRLNLLHSIVPIFLNDSSNNQVVGFIEFFDDVTTEYKVISYSEKSALAAMILILVIYILTVFYYSFQAQKIITIQHELNREHQEAKFKAEEESQKKSQFLANVSHELRTPLNSIIGFSEIISSASLGPIGDPKYQEYGKDINTSGNHLLSLINDILDFSKAEADKLEVEAIEMDLTKVALNSLKMVQTRAENGKVILKTQLPENHLIMIADPKRMKQIFLNLLSNAVKFTPEGGEVKLSMHVENNKIIIKVTDTGIGIADKDISRALSVFGQVDNKLSRKYEGTGLGLPLTKKLVELMNGTFELTSAETFGTTVTLKFNYNDSIQNS